MTDGSVVDRGVAVSPDVLTARMDGQTLLLDLRSMRYFRLNQTAAAIWHGLERGDPDVVLAVGLCREFEIDDNEAVGAVEAFIRELRRRRLLQPPLSGPEG